MECTSKSIYIGNRWDAGAFASGFLLHPFAPLANTRRLHHPIAVCFHCGAYINKYCPIEENLVLWKCSLCGKENKLLSSSPSAFNDDDNMLEIQEICEEHVSTVAAPTLADHAYICILDATAIAENDLSSFFTSLLTSLPMASRVGIIIIGRCISILRLCGCSFPMCCDVLPASSAAGSILSPFIDQGEYFAPAGKALESLPLLLQSIQALADSTHATTLTALSSLLSSLSDIKGPGLRCLLVTSHAILVDSAPLAQADQRVMEIGRQLALCGCFIDIICCGIQQVDYSILDSFASATGGRVYTALSLSDETIALILKHVFTRPITSFCAKGHCASLEIRCSEKALTIDSVLGSVVAAADCPSSNIVPFNSSHIRANMHAAANYDQIIASITSASQSITLCALPRCDPDAVVSVSYALIANALRKCNGVVVQAIVRYDDNTAMHTRVLTVRYDISTSISDYWASVHKACYTSHLCRHLVAQLHENPTKPITARVDALAKDIIECIWDLQSKLPVAIEYELIRELEDICRILYHLREGPLLNGPATDLHEAHLLRSHYLSVSGEQAAVYVMPSVQRMIIDSATIITKENVNELLLPCLPDIVVMIPNSITIVDLGSHIIVRVDRSLDVSEEVTEVLYDVVRKVQAKKTICPTILFTRSGQSAERMLFSRLAPAHNDTADILSLYHPEYKSMKNASDVLEQFPITDQKSFAMYAAGVSPKFMNATRKYRAGNMVTSVPSEPPIERLPQQNLLTGQIVSHGYRPATGYDNL